MSDKTELRRKLFLRGAPSYVDALAALDAFDEEVEDLCKKAWSRYKDRILPAMGISDNGSFERYTDLELAERWAAVGIYRGVQKSGVNGPCFYIYLSFDESDDDSSEVSATVWLDFPSRRLRDEIYDEIRRKNPHCEIGTNDEEEFWALKSKVPLVLTNPEEALDKLLSNWIGYCESIDGLKLRER